jgi:DNA-binding MurR/RpiR family transcriptional regulator
MTARASEIEAALRPSGADASKPGGLLEERVIAIQKRLTPKQKQLARVMLENELALAFASAGEIGRQAGVDSATVVRFSRLLGFEGWADLRDTIRQSVPDVITANEVFRRRLQEPDSAGDLLEEVFKRDIENLRETVARNDSKQIKDIVTSISNAESVYVVGFGLESYVAEYLAFHLALIGVRAPRPPGGIFDATASLATVTSADVVVGLGVWRYLNDTIKLVEFARARGATIVAITDSKISPLAVSADHLLLASMESSDLPASITALSSLASVIVAGVGLSRRSSALKALGSVDDYYSAVGAMRE